MPKIISVTTMDNSNSCLPGILFKDDQCYYHAYVPSLDIAGYGSTKEEAKDSLQVTLRIYFEKLMQERGLFKDLQEHGWMIGPHDVIPPDLLNSGLGGLENCIQNGTKVYQIHCKIKWPAVGMFG